MEPPTLGAALLCSSLAGTDLWLYPGFIYWTCRNHQYGLRLEDMYSELNAFPDRKSNLGPFNLEPMGIYHRASVIIHMFASLK